MEHRELVGSFVAYLMRNVNKNIVGFRIQDERIKLYMSNGSTQIAYPVERVYDNEDITFIKYDNIIYKGDTKYSQATWCAMCKAYA